MFLIWTGKKFSCFDKEFNIAGILYMEGMQNWFEVLYIVHREIVYNVDIYQKYLTRLGEVIIFEPWGEIIISSNRVRYFWYTTALFMYSIYISTSDLLSFISNTDIHELSSVWKWISSSNDVINHVDCIIKYRWYIQKKQCIGISLVER